MSNKDVSKMTDEEFLAYFETINAKKTEKPAINTAPLTLDKQLERFNDFSFTKEGEEALYEDALSI